MTIKVTLTPALMARLDMVRGRAARAFYAREALIKAMDTDAMSCGVDPNQQPLPLPEKK